MIHVVRGDLFASGAQAIVNAVNTVGVMGKGIALEFKQRFPENFALYAEACARRELRVGRLFVTERTAGSAPRWIINFPTKEHWRNPSRIEWIEEGLCDLRWVVTARDIRSVAIPALGCGNGGLQWTTVRATIERALADLPGVEVRLYEPA